MAAVDKLVTCPICLDWFRSPRRLPCHHIYCLECLRGLVVHGKDYITCPVCSRDHVMPNERVEDYPIDGRLEQFIAAQRQPNADRCKVCHQELSVGECEHCQLLTCLQCQTTHRGLLVASLVQQWGQFSNDYFSDKQMVARQKQKNELIQQQENIETYKISVNQEIDNMINALEIRLLTLITRSEEKEHFITDELLKLDNADVIFAHNPKYITRLAETSSVTEGVVSMKEELDEQLQFMTSLQSGPIKKEVWNISFKEKQELLELIENYGQISIHVIVDYRSEFTLIKTIDGSESGGVFKNPHGVTVCPYTDNVYITDDTSIRVYDNNGVCIHDRPTVSIDQPRGLAIDSKRRVIVTCWEDENVNIYNQDLIKSFGSRGERNGEFRGPYGVTCDQDDNIYVADYINNRVQVFTREGTFLSVIGHGRLQLPAYIQINQQQEVMATNGDRVDIFHRDGKHLRTITGDGDNKLKSPIGICLDATGQILVADYDTNKIQVYTAHGNHYCSIDKPEAAMESIQGLAVTKSGVIFITDISAGKIHLISTT